MFLSEQGHKNNTNGSLATLPNKVGRVTSDQKVGRVTSDPLTRLKGWWWRYRISFGCTPPENQDIHMKIDAWKTILYFPWWNGPFSGDIHVRFQVKKPMKKSSASSFVFFPVFWHLSIFFLRIVFVSVVLFLWHLLQKGSLHLFLFLSNAHPSRQMRCPSEPTNTSWWLNHPFEKYAQIKLDQFRKIPKMFETRTWNTVTCQKTKNGHDNQNVGLLCSIHFGLLIIFVVFLILVLVFVLIIIFLSWQLAICCKTTSGKSKSQNTAKQSQKIPIPWYSWWTNIHKKKQQINISLVIQNDLFGMVKWPFQRLLVTSNVWGWKGHGLNHLVHIIFFVHTNWTHNLPNLQLPPAYLIGMRGGKRTTDLEIFMA